MSLEAWGDEGDVGPEGYVTEEYADEMVEDATAELKAQLATERQQNAELREAYKLRTTERDKYMTEGEELKAKLTWLLNELDLRSRMQYTAGRQEYPNRLMRLQQDYKEKFK